MMKFLRGRRKRLVLDIGTSAVRLCEIQQTKTGYQLTRYYQNEYDSDPTHDEDKKRNLRVKALTDLLKENKIRTRKTVFAVPGQSVFTRSRALPPVPEYKVNQIVRYEIQQQIPFSLDQIAMDYQILDRTEAGGYEVMMAAIKTDVVDKHIDVIQAAKRSIDTVDVAPLAAYNWLKHTGEFGDQGDCVALVDLGATTTDIVIERENQFRFTRPLNLGGNDITKALSSAFQLNFSDAEKLKRQRAFAPTGDPERDGQGGQVVGEVLQRLVSEIMRSFGYFRSLPGGGQVNRVVLCGGGACLRNIVPFMQQQLGLEVRIAQPTAGLAIAPAAQQINDDPEHSCVVLGLALRCRQAVPLEINLIPPRVLEASRRREQAFYWALSLATLALIMASIIPDQANKNEAILMRIDLLKSHLREYDPLLAQLAKPGAIPTSDYVAGLRNSRSAIEGLQGLAKRLDTARNERRFWLDELSFINSLRPKTGERLFFTRVETIWVPAKPAAGRGAAGPPARPGFGPGARPRPPAAPRSTLGGSRGTGGAGKTVGGFPGVEPPGGITRTTSGSGFGSGGRLGGGAVRNRGGAGKRPQSIQLHRPSGFLLYGVGDSDRAITQFVDALENSDPWPTPNRYEYIKIERVNFSTASVRKIDERYLWDAPIEDTPGLGPSPIYNPKDDPNIYTFQIRLRLTRYKEVPGAPASGQPAGDAGS